MGRIGPSFPASYKSKSRFYISAPPISSDNLSKSDIEFRERANPPNVESLLMLPTPRRHLLANSGGNEPNWDTFNGDVISGKLGNLSVSEKVRKK